MDQNGVPDLLFQNQQQLSVWYMAWNGNNNTILSSPVFGTAASGWQLRGTSALNPSGNTEPDLIVA